MIEVMLINVTSELKCRSLLMIGNSQSSQWLCLFYLLKVICKFMDVLCILTEFHQFVLYYGFDKVGNNSSHFTSFLVIFRDTLRLLEVFKGKSFDKFCRNSWSFNKSSNYIDKIEANRRVKNSFEIICNDRIISKLRKKNCSDIWIKVNNWQ